MHCSSGNTAFVPLYACERCGYTSAEFRPEAARLHRLEYPDCDGVMRIIFRSEERYRGELYIPPQPRTSPEPRSTSSRRSRKQVFPFTFNIPAYPGQLAS